MIDFIKGLPKSLKFNCIMVVVDRMSKYSHFIPLKHPFTATQVVDYFIKEIVRLHGIPCTIISDRDKVFTSTFWKVLFCQQGSKLQMSSSYHPQTDGQTTIVNLCLESYLRCFVSENSKLWAKWLYWAEYSYNTTFHASLVDSISGTTFHFTTFHSLIKDTPFKVVYGWYPPKLLHDGSPPSPVDSVDTLLRERGATLSKLKQHLRDALSAMKKKADQHRRELQFEVGD